MSVMTRTSRGRMRVSPNRSLFSGAVRGLQRRGRSEKVSLHRASKRERVPLTSPTLPASLRSLSINRKVPAPVVCPPLVARPTPLRRRIRPGRSSCQRPPRPFRTLIFSGNLVPPLLVLMNMLDSPRVEPRFHLRLICSLASPTDEGGEPSCEATPAACWWGLEGESVGWREWRE